VVNTPHVPFDAGNRPLGRVVLADGTIIEVPLGYRDLVNGGVVFDISEVELALHDGKEQPIEELLGVDAENDSQVWIPGSEIQRVILSVGQRGSRRAGFFS